MMFPKYNTLPSELRSHVLSYNDYKTLSNYAPCSKLCSQEVQRTHVDLPSRIELEDMNTTYHSGVKVTLSYDAPQWMSYQIKFVNMDGNRYMKGLLYGSHTSEYDGDAHQAAVEYIKDRLKYAKTGGPIILRINTSVWPSDLWKLPVIQEQRDWTITISQSMYQAFYESITIAPMLGARLKLLKYRNQPFTIPAQFFETSFFQNLEEFECFDVFLSEISPSSFLSMKATSISMRIVSLPLNVVNQKLAQWFNNPIGEIVWYRFYVRRQDITVIKDAILANLPFRDVEGWGPMASYDDRSRASIYINEEEISFRTFPLLRR